MQNRRRIGLLLFLITGVLIILAGGCKKKGTDMIVVSPSLADTKIIAITETTAIIEGSISSNNGAPVTVSGVCWNTTSRPTLGDPQTTDGETMGLFVSTMKNLLPATKYYVRTYATNDAGTTYGHEISFTTSTPPATLPVIATTDVVVVSLTVATGGGNITSDGGAPVTARGICWKTSTGATIADNKVVDSGTGSGMFTSSMTGLTPSTKYYVRAYATNSVGTAYGPEVVFTSGALSTYVIGQHYGGGIIFYIDGTGQHGLINAEYDQSPKAENWDTAMALCNNLVLNGYSDWYLPSKDELNLLYLQKTVVGGFADYGYYSSTEQSATVVWRQAFGSGKQLTGSKANASYVRAIRAF